MQVTVKLFAVARQVAGVEQLTLELPTGATVADLRQALAETSPELAPLLPSMAVAIDAEYVDDAAPVRADAEIACIPPVSGG